MTYYANATDSTLSGWGQAKGGKSYFCIKCDTVAQLEAAQHALHTRPEMRFVSTSDRPRGRKTSNDHVSIHYFWDLASNWRRFYDADHDDELTAEQRAALKARSDTVAS